MAVILTEKWNEKKNEQKQKNEDPNAHDAPHIMFSRGKKRNPQVSIIIFLDATHEKKKIRLQ